MEKRKYHRYLLVIDIEHKIDGEDESHVSRTKDISEGGLCITTIGFPLEQDKLYVFNLTLPGEFDSIQVKGKIAWTREAKSDGEKLYDNGIEFIDISKSVLNTISEFSIGTVDH